MPDPGNKEAQSTSSWLDEYDMADDIDPSLQTNIEKLNFIDLPNETLSAKERRARFHIELTLKQQSEAFKKKAMKRAKHEALLVEHKMAAIFKSVIQAEAAGRFVITSEEGKDRIVLAEEDQPTSSWADECADLPDEMLSAKERRALSHMKLTQAQQEAADKKKAMKKANHEALLAQHKMAAISKGVIQAETAERFTIGSEEDNDRTVLAEEEKCLRIVTRAWAHASSLCAEEDSSREIIDVNEMEKRKAISLARELRTKRLCSVSNDLRAALHIVPKLTRKALSL